MKTLMLAIILLASCQTIISAQDIHYKYLAVTPSTDSTYLAIRVPMDELNEVIGMRWFNEDRNAEYPDARLLMMAEEGQPSMLGAEIVATDLSGADSSWTDIEFAEPVSSEAGDLFLAIRFPEEQEVEDYGIKPGIGYTVAPGGPEAWITADGENWTKLHVSVSVKLEILYGAGKSLGGKVMRAPIIPAYITRLMTPTPNPFNPRTKLQYSLAEDGYVELIIYNARGAVVNILVSGELTAGNHEAVWGGADSNGRTVASGLYLARLKTRAGSEIQRMMLVR